MQYSAKTIYALFAVTIISNPIPRVYMIKYNRQDYSTILQIKHSVLLNHRQAKMQTLINPYCTPYIYAIASNILFILAQFIAKLQTSLVSPMFIVYFRSLLLLALNSFLISNHNTKAKQTSSPSSPTPSQILYAVNRQSPNPNVIKLDIMHYQTFVLMAKRVLFACLSMAFYTMALQNLQLSITNALFQTAPIFAFFIDAVVSKVPIKLFSGKFYSIQITILKVHLILTLISFIGVLFILLPASHPSSSTDPTLSPSSFRYILPLLAAFTSACSMSYLHKLKQKVHPLLTLQYLMIGALIMSGILFNFESEPIIHKTAESSLFSSIFSGLFILSTILMSMLVFMSQYFRVKSLFILPASKVCPLHYFGIVLSIWFDLVVFGYEIKWYQYIGMGLASSGLMMKLLIERNEQEAKSSKSGSGKF